MDVTSGSISVPLVLSLGPNTIALTVTNDADQSTTDTINVTYAVPNEDPTLTFDEPGDLTTDDTPIAAGTA